MSQDDDAVKLLLSRWRSGDQAAAGELYQRYAERLRGRIQTKIGRRLARRVDADDIVLSAFRTFFRRTRAGQYVIGHANALLGLLVRIALNKIRKQAEWNDAGRRDQRLEVEDGEEWLRHAVARGPTPEEAAVLLDEVEAVRADLGDRAQEVLLLRLAEHSMREIGERLGCSHSTVSRTLERIWHRFEQRLQS